MGHDFLIQASAFVLCAGVTTPDGGLTHNIRGVSLHHSPLDCHTIFALFYGAGIHKVSVRIARLGSTDRPRELATWTVEFTPDTPQVGHLCDLSGEVLDAGAYMIDLIHADRKDCLGSYVFRVEGAKA